MNKWILSLACFAFVSFAKAQFYTIDPGDTVEAIIPANTFMVYDIYQHNATADTIQLAWTKVYESIPTGWDYSLCDFGTCYPGFPASGTMALVAPPDSGFLGVNVDAYNFPGTLIIRFYVYETSAPSQGDTLTWIITAPITGVEEITSPALNIYPNPATEYITLGTVNTDFPATISLFDINGQLMLNQNIMDQNQTIDVHTLPSGTYVLQMQNKQIVRRTFVKE